MIKIKMEKDRKWNRKEKEVKRKREQIRKKQVRKKMEKEKISCLAKKRHAFEKRRFPTFLWKKNSLIITNFLENVSTPEG